MSASQTRIVRTQAVPVLHVVKAPGGSAVDRSRRLLERQMPSRATGVFAARTLAEARRWAKAKGRSVYRVGLSQIVSKHIGETEKNLAAAFAEAEKRDAVLLLDEADALFSQRTEVKDSSGRYANVEVNELLAQLEEKQGVLRLSAKRKADLDDAFLRRLRFIEAPAPTPHPPRGR